MELHKKKDEIQQKARKEWESKGCRGTLALATGVGKSKIAVDIVKESKGKWLLVVPTEKLRDENWKEEFKKWKATRAYNSRLERTCYASLNNVDGEFEGIILDECHNITEAKSDWFDNHKEAKILGLSATYPTDMEKRLILDKQAPIVYEYSLDDAVNDGVVAPYEIIVVQLPLEGVRKTVKAGSKKKPFMTTELNHYAYLSKVTRRLMFDKTPKGQAALKFAILNRMRFIYNLQSKTEVARYILDNYLADERHLVFAGSIKQAEELCPHRFHSKSGDKDLKKFQKKRINQLSCVQALNEGANIPDLDSALVVQVTSNERHLIQRIGRIIRYREGHTGKIYILCTTGTKDEDWVEKALSSFDTSRITYMHYKNLIK